MKKIIFSLITSLLILLTFSANSFAANVNIGVVDTQKIIASSSMYATYRKSLQELANMEQAIQKEYADKMQKFQQAMQQNKSKEELQKLHDQYTKELNAKVMNLQKSVQAKQQNIESLRNQLRSKVESAIKVIAQQKKLTHVVDKQAMFFGGVDITNDVLKRVK